MNRSPISEGLSVDELRQSQRLFARLARIQRSISHRAPLQEVLDAIVAGASELLGDEVVGLRLIDEKDPTRCRLVACRGLKDHLAGELQLTPVDQGAGGVAIRENRLVVIESYEESPQAFRSLADDGLKAAMAVPVQENGVVMGSLVVASYRKGRTFTAGEREALIAFSEHAGLALTDAKMIEAMRETQSARELFNAMVSHELKNPLTVITGTLQTLSRHHQRLTDEMCASLIASAQERAHELRKMIDRLLEGARAELAGSTREAFFPDLVADAINGFQEARRLSVGEVPAVLVTVDAPAVHELIGILLENAVSHSPQGSQITIEARLEDGGVALAVRNVGTLPDELEKSSLFTPFRRGPAAVSPGVGLGLYIAYRLAQAIHGRIDVSSENDCVESKLYFPVQTRAHVGAGSL